MKFTIELKSGLKRKDEVIYKSDFDEELRALNIVSNQNTIPMWIRIALRNVKSIIQGLKDQAPERPKDV